MVLLSAAGVEPGELADEVFETVLQAGDGAEFRDKMARLLEAEAHSEPRKETLAGAFNRGFGDYALTGNITNGPKGTLAINANSSFNGTGASLVNEGAINLATGVALSAAGAPTISNEGGSITATGTGALVETTGTFNEGLGKTSTAKTSEPVILDRVALHLAQAAQ